MWNNPIGVWCVNIGIDTVVHYTYTVCYSTCIELREGTVGCMSVHSC